MIWCNKVFSRFFAILPQCQRIFSAIQRPFSLPLFQIAVMRCSGGQIHTILPQGFDWLIWTTNLNLIGWLIWTISLNVIGWLNCSITNCPKTNRSIATWQVKVGVLTGLIAQNAATHPGLKDKTRQDKTSLFNQGSPISCKAGILRGPGFNKTYIYTFTTKLQGEVKFAKITGGKKKRKKIR